MFGKQLFMRFGEVQVLDETHRSVRFEPSTPPPPPSLIKMLDPEIIDSGFTVSDTLPGGVKPR